MNSTSWSARTVAPDMMARALLLVAFGLMPALLVGCRASAARDSALLGLVAAAMTSLSSIAPRGALQPAPAGAGATRRR